MAGLDPAIHAAPPQMSLAANGARLQKQNVLTSPLPCGCSLRRNTWMAGTSPAMTLQVGFAPPRYPEFPGCQQLALREPRYNFPILEIKC
jgi:hypothetical protein